jgi:hypothetical protein
MALPEHQQKEAFGPVNKYHAWSELKRAPSPFEAALHYLLNHKTGSSSSNIYVFDVDPASSAA